MLMMLNGDNRDVRRYFYEELCIKLMFILVDL